MASPPVRVGAPVQVQTTPAVETMEAPPIELPKLDQLVLVSPGTGKRAPLRYQLAEGTQTVRAATQLSSREISSGAPALALPAITDALAVTVAPGKLELRVVTAEVAAATDPAKQAAEQYAAGWRALRDRRATATIDDRGRLGAIAFGDDPTGAGSRDARDELAQRLVATVVPLPDEPVGIGASWRAITVLRQNHAYVKQTATYTLVERAPQAWKLKVSLLRVAEEQRVADPSLPADATVELLALFRKLDGTATIDPRRAVIARGALDIESRVHIRISVPGREPVEQVFEDLGKVAFTAD